MEFILAQLSMLMWLSLISFILAEFPVQQLKILISGGTGSAVFFFFFFFFFFVPKRQQQYCMSFEFMQSISSNSTHSEQPWQISLNALLTPYPLCALAQTHKQTHVQKKKKNASPFTPSTLIFSPSFSSWLSLSGSARGGRECIDLPKWAAISQGESAQRFCPWMGIAHFTWPPCL